MTNLTNRIKKTISIILCMNLIICLFVSPGFSKSKNMGQGVYGNGTIYKTDGFEIDFSTITLGEVEHTYRNSESKKTEQIDVNNVGSIKVESGSYAIEWALILGVAALFGSKQGEKNAKETAEFSGNEFDEGKAQQITFLMTGGFALLGALIGSTQKKYKTIYKNPNFGFGIQMKSYKLVSSGNSVFLNMKHSF